MKKFSTFAKDIADIFKNREKRRILILRFSTFLKSLFVK